MQRPVLIVFSHLRWGFVYQRPQHLLSRLADRWQILFVEEPVHTEAPARLEVREEDGVSVLVPHSPVPACGFHDDQIGVIQTLLDAYLTAHSLTVDTAWLYTPMALPLANALAPACFVYDCMDELSAFQGAPRQLRQRESALMQQAGLVLTGGPSLYEARKSQHPNIHCFRSSVDASHYAPGNLDPDSSGARIARSLQETLPHPRLGFFGVIDERFDLELLHDMACRHPEWSLVMVGPVVKIDASSLPRHPNVHWLGMQSYETLPHLLAGWDVALMPFAMNESTRFISPTKTLEYMAGDKPVASTPVQDVMALYASGVAIAPASHPFIEACEGLLAEDEQARQARHTEMARLVSAGSWDATADAIHELLAEALQRARETADTAPAVLDDAEAEKAVA